jgi:hypothetical protein
MSNDPVGRRPRSAGLHSTLRAAALAAVALGVMLLAAAAFVLSYEGIHHIALRAGVSPELAKLYPLIFDVMLVVAGAAALALRGASLWARCYAWGLLLILLAAMAVGNAVYATGTTLPAQPTKITVAVIPWVLLLMAFGLLLELLRHFRSTRSSAAIATPDATASGAAAAGTAAAANVNGGPQTAGTQAAASGGKALEPSRVDLDTLLGPKDGEPPAIAILHGIGTGQNDGHQVDPVSYGEETGYVHPDSYLDEGEYSPHGDTGGPGSPDGLAGDRTHLAGHGTAPAEAAAALAPATSAEPAATPAAAPITDTEPLFTPAAAPITDTEPLFTPAAAPATSAETPATPAEPSATPAEPSATSAEPPTTSTQPPTTPTEAPATAAETPAASPAATAAVPVAAAAPVGAPAGEAASGTGNGLAAGGGPPGAETPAGQEGAAEAGQEDGAGVKQEAVAAEGPALERIRSTPTRPE